MTDAIRQDLQGIDQRAFDLSVQAYSASDNYFTGSVQAGMDDDLRRFYGLHPQGSKYSSPEYQGRSKLFRPKTRAAIRSQEATAAEAFFSTEDVLSVMPENEDDPTHKASSEIWQTILQARLTRPGPVGLPWFLTVLGAYQDAMTSGVCISYNHWQYDKARNLDRPMVLLRPPENIRFDPGAQWWDPVNTSPYWIDQIPMYVKDIKAMAQTRGQNGEPRWLTMTDAQLLRAKTKFANSTRYVREHNRQDSTDSGQTINEYSLVWVHRNIVEINGQDYVFYTLSDIALLSKPRPLEEVYWHGIRPYTMGFCVVETHKTHPSGLSRLGKDQQAEINEIANSRIDNIKLAMMKRWLVKRNRNVDVASLRRAVPNSVTMVNELEDVEPLEFNDVTASAYQEQERLNVDFDDSMGSFSGGSVQSNRALNETVGGLNLLSASMNKVSGYQLKVFTETWLESTLNQVMELEKKYESSQALFTLAAKSSPAYQKLAAELGSHEAALTEELLDQPLTVRVNVGMNATDPIRKVERFIMAISKFREALADGVLQSNGANIEEITKEIFGALGYKSGRRFFDFKENPMVAQLQQQVQALQQELKSKREDPALTSAKVQHLQAQTQEILSRIAMGDQQVSPEDVKALQDRLAQVEDEHAKTVDDYEQQIAALKFDAEDQSEAREKEYEAKRYETDARIKADTDKAAMQEKTKMEIAKLQAARDKELDGMKAQIAELKKALAKVGKAPKAGKK